MTIKRDHIIKLDRARTHIKYLEDKLTEWFDNNHYSIAHEEEPNRPHHFTARITIKPLTGDPLAVVIGDAIHNLRSTLDHLMYLLASTHVKPFTGEIAKLSEFPIFGDELGKGDILAEKRLEKKFAPILNAIPPNSKTIIKRVQPYQRGKAFASHPLWKLYVLSNTDKHRLLLDAAMYNVAITVSRGEFINIDSYKINVLGGPMNDQAVIAKYSVVPKDSSRKVHVQIDPVINVVFGHRTGLDGKDVMDVLHEIHDYIIGYVVNPLDKFL